jgi:SAM-dependent methyltransferase
MTAAPDEPRPVCDYEGHDYRGRFWQGQGREYEDQVERIALRRLMPRWGDTLLDVGAGFGRLADEYDGYRRIVLFDYSRSLLREARTQLGDDPRMLFVAGDWYHLPFVPGSIGTIVQVRTLHHAADVRGLFAQLARVARPGGHYILEFASKRNLKAIIRHAFRRQEWSPFDLAPIEFEPLHFNFHPRWIRRQLRTAGFAPGPTRTVSHFRLPLVKRIVPTRWLVSLDRLAQPSGRLWQLTPSVFIASQNPRSGDIAPHDQLFACPACALPLPPSPGSVYTCPQGHRWAIRDGIHDFKEPVTS